MSDKETFISDFSLRLHRETHTRMNSWWLNDAKNIPLCRVCDDCLDIVMKRYLPEVLGLSGQYEDVVDETIEEDY
jgi:hypothetical protein